MSIRNNSLSSGVVTFSKSDNVERKFVELEETEDVKLQDFEYDGLVWEIGLSGIVIPGSGDTYNSGYSNIIERLHPDIKNWIWEEEENYQGDFYGLGMDLEGYHCFISGSFGSCSGCDWLQSISTFKDATEFLTHYKKVIIKKPNKKAMEEYLKMEHHNACWKEGINNLLMKLSSKKDCEN